MNADLWRSEVITYGFMILNMFAVAALLGWAWRRGMFKDLDDTMHTALGLPADPSNLKENEHV